MSAEFNLAGWSDFAITCIRFGALAITTACVGLTAWFVLKSKKDKEYRVLFRNLAIAFGVLSLCGMVAVVLELIIGNPNAWLGMKIAFYVAVWLWIIVSVVNGKIKTTKPWYAASITATVCMAGLFVYAIANEVVKCHVDSELVSTVELVAVGDSYAVSGEGHGSLLHSSMVISTNDVYRYYYKTKSGAISQGSIPASQCYIYFIGEDDIPRLEKLRSYDYYLGTVNHQIRRKYQNLEDEYSVIWYDLYVPEGAIINDFSFDLK